MEVPVKLLRQLTDSLGHTYQPGKIGVPHKGYKADCPRCQADKLLVNAEDVNGCLCIDFHYSPTLSAQEIEERVSAALQQHCIEITLLSVYPPEGWEE